MKGSPYIVWQVGAGPTGLVAALSLAQNGIPARIIDKHDGPQHGQRGAALQVMHLPRLLTQKYSIDEFQPRVLELFGLVGVAHEVLKEAGPLQIPLSYDLPGSKPRAEVKFPLPLRRAPSPEIPYVSMNQCFVKIEADWVE